MNGEEPSETLRILLEVKKQMAELEGKVDRMQRARTSSSFDADPEESEDSAGKLVELLGVHYFTERNGPDRTKSTNLIS